MRPPPFEYLEAATVPEACAALAGAAPAAAVLAGGQSLVAQLNNRDRRPALVVGIGRIPELGTVEIRDGELLVGAAVTQRALQRSVPAARVPVLLEALGHVGHVPTRNRGTLGGSIAFADPAAELPTVLLGLGGSALLSSVAGERTVAAGALFTGPFRTALRPDELLTSVRLPVPGPGERWAFEQRHFRRHAKVSVVVGVAGPGRDLAEVRLALGGVTDRPVTVPEAGALLRAAASPAAGIADVVEAVAELVTPNVDRYGSVDYRRQLAAVATRAALGRVLGPARGTAAA